jgi:hypothetical protein
MPGYEVAEPRLRCVLPFKAVPAEVRLLRRAALTQLTRWGIPVAADEAGLLVAELATNVIKHVGEGASATLVLEWCSERLRLEAHDRSCSVPLLASAGCEDECGRGLRLITALAADWGTIVTDAGKAVWCEVPLSADAACRRIARAVGVLERYRGSGGSCEGLSRAVGLEQSAVELIADLLHWSVAQGRDPDDILDRAQMHYEAEAKAA